MAELLWQPSEEQIKNSNMYRFMNVVNEKYHQNFSDFAPLYQWSIENIADFWETMWEFADIVASKPYDQVIDDDTKMPGARWFTGARLNFAENLLRYRDDRIALIFKGEAQESIKMTYAELYDEVARLANGLKAAGVQSGDRVVVLCRICRLPLLPCWPQPVGGQPGRRVLLTSALKACWIDSVRSNPRFYLPRTVIHSKAKSWIPWDGSPIF